MWHRLYSPALAVVCVVVRVARYFEHPINSHACILSRGSERIPYFSGGNTHTRILHPHPHLHPHLRVHLRRGFLFIALVDQIHSQSYKPTRFFVRLPASLASLAVISHHALLYTTHRRPCRAYTPKLASLYTRAKAQHKAFEVVFVSLDGDEESMHR